MGSPNGREFIVYLEGGNKTTVDRVFVHLTLPCFGSRGWKALQFVISNNLRENVIYMYVALI